GTAHYKNLVNNSFANGGQGGELTFTLRLDKSSRWFANDTYTDQLYGRAFIVTFGKKGESTTFGKQAYVAAGGGGSTGMAWVVPSMNSVWFNSTVIGAGYLIAGVGG